MMLAAKFSLAGKSAVVTGAGNGIGRAVAIAFAEAGANVACVDLDRTAAEATAAAIGKAAIAVACDVSNEAQVEAAAKTVLARYPAIHVLLNGAAGHDPNGTVLELTLADWNEVFAVNVAGAFLMSRAILPAKAMATDHAAQNIRVNTLSPGAVETERLVKRFGDMETARRTAAPKHLLQRLGQPEEIAQAAVFLASDASSFMTGADLLVDGGYNAT